MGGTQEGHLMNTDAYCRMGGRQEGHLLHIVRFLLYGRETERALTVHCTLTAVWEVDRKGHLLNIVRFLRYGRETGRAFTAYSTFAAVWEGDRKGIYCTLYACCGMGGTQEGHLLNTDAYCRMGGRQEGHLLHIVRFLLYGRETERALTAHCTFAAVWEVDRKDTYCTLYVFYGMGGRQEGHLQHIVRFLRYGR